jgi:hypothetical protein
MSLRQSQRKRPNTDDNHHWEARQASHRYNVRLYNAETECRFEPAKAKDGTHKQRKFIDCCIQLKISDDIGQGASARLLGTRELKGSRDGKVPSAEENHHSGKVSAIHHVPFDKADNVPCCRLHQCDIRVYEDTVSRLHCQICVADDGKASVNQSCRCSKLHS